MFLGVLAAAVGIPYAWSNFNPGGTAENALQPVAGGNDGTNEVDTYARLLEGEKTSDGAQIDRFKPTGTRPPPAQLTGEPTQNLLEVLRFDVTPQWVMSRWSRVSTTLAETELEGFRVPLTTGYEVDDLAGSLTYYFDKHERLQRITFDGTTGDARALAALLTQHYGFRKEPTLGAGLYLVKWNGTPTSVMRIRYAPVVRASTPNSRLHVKLEINRPRMKYGLSAGMRAMLRQDRESKRW